MSADGAKRMRQLAKKLEEIGWDVRITGGSHWRFAAPTGEIVFAPFTPSDTRSVANTISQLRAAGLAREVRP